MDKGQAKKNSLKSGIEQEKTARKKSYVLDLRIHTPASLGYLGIDGIDTAPAMVRLAKVKGLDVIAVTDFHTSIFIDRVLDAAKGSKLTVLPGVSLRCQLATCRDVVLVCLFPEHCRAEHVSRFLEAVGLPSQQVGNEEYVLTTPFSRVLEVVEEFSGIAIPSRMDKTPHQMKIIPQLVEEFGFRTFDLAYADSKKFFKTHWPKEHFNLYSFSSASALAQVGSRNAKVKLPDASFASIREVTLRADRLTPG